MKTPVLFIVFNRPDTTKKVFETIKNAKPKKLYVTCDGPRKDNLEDIINIRQVKKIIEDVDWDCEVYKLYRDTNLGCKSACREGIDWFFDNEEEGIILEDDTLPNNTFYRFSEIMLEKYRDNKVIMHIGGFKPRYIGRDEFSISFTRVSHVWGWSTWRDRWKFYDEDIIGKDKLKILHKYDYFKIERKTKGRIKILKQVSEGNIDSWDYQWDHTVRSNSGLAIRPCVNLVENIGIGHKNATHTKNKFNVNVPYSEDLDLDNLILPPWIIPNRTLEKQYENNM